MKTRATILGLMLGACAVQASATGVSGKLDYDSQPDSVGRAGVGMFFAHPRPNGLGVRTGVSVSLGGRFAKSGNADFVGSLRYTHYTFEKGGRVTLVHTMVDAEYQLDPAGRWFLSPSVGVVFGDSSDNIKSQSFAWGLAAIARSGNLSFEARWLRGDNVGEHGFVFGFGLRF